ncbi:hypothetical protein MPER_12411 [Moniliophthora perniciosa FA553]|nr:hypothetical protein MPER_12411 [Moniliophthora perniciosa FA553]
MGWEQRVDLKNRVYFVDHHSKTTTWKDPRLRPDVEIRFTGASNTPYYIDHRTGTTSWGDPRFPGNTRPAVEIRCTEDGKLFYVDHRTKQTSWSNPRGATSGEF